MGLDVWFREDIARALEAAHTGLGAVMRILRRGNADGALYCQGYKQGYQDALAIVADIFGITKKEEEDTAPPIINIQPIKPRTRQDWGP